MDKFYELRAIYDKLKNKIEAEWITLVKIGGSEFPKFDMQDAAAILYCERELEELFQNCSLTEKEHVFDNMGLALYTAKRLSNSSMSTKNIVFFASWIVLTKNDHIMIEDDCIDEESIHVDIGNVTTLEDVPTLSNLSFEETKEFLKDRAMSTLLNDTSYGRKRLGGILKEKCS